MQKKLFGTDGIRGKANLYPINSEVALKLGQAIGIYFKQRHPNPKILIGKDTRRSGYMLEQALASGICSVGVHVNFLGPLPTPGIAYLTRGLRACAGIVISASHNPYDDNGIKIFAHNGKKLDDQAELTLEKMILSDNLNENPPVGTKVGTAKRIDDAIGQYAVFLKERFPREYTLEGLRIVLDCANGAAYKVAPKVFEELGADVMLIGAEPNGTNINEGCGALHPYNLAEKVKRYKANIGIALDGDADRIIVCDEKGAILDGDEYLAILAMHMIKNKTLVKNTVVSTIMSNIGLEQALNKFGGKLVRTQVGDRYVMEEMNKNSYNLGGEQSGHIILSDHTTTGDGILAGLRLLAVMRNTNMNLSELRTIITKFPQVTKSVQVKKKVPLDELKTLQKEIQKIEKEMGADGRVLIRYSGTENKARIMVEGKKIEEVNTYVDHLTKVTLASIEAAL